ncbi:DUF4232 domain-containing protein [Nocardia sp. ET3-3]|uniref:DUF4232 domain-containing protein n=1 Tax=Nocardia terrae TaxID=2675851 RepID=A0A7K1UWD7_9NOCA|nr:DUF4232 domain-containing protein [Nocardia terrae]MVU78602.1 DUF4232 domain-containing protein [Nocardia terrae]
MRFRRGIFAIAVGALAIAAAACSSGTSTTSPPPATSAAPGGATTSQATAPAASAAPTAPFARFDPCGSGQVDVTAEVMSPGTGHRGVKLTFSLAAGAAPCTLSGYPGVDSGAGGPLVHADRTPRGYMGGLPQGSDEPPMVTLQSGHPASAVVEGVAFDAAGNGCPLYTSLAVTPPNSTDTRTVTVTIDTCALQVHPVTG